MTFDEAIQVAYFAFKEQYKNATIPPWLMKLVTPGGRKDTEGNWQISLTIARKLALEENEFWEIKDNSPVLMELDPVTGERFVVIDKAVEPLIIFTVLIQPEKRAFEVLTALPLMDLSEADFLNGI